MRALGVESEPAAQQQPRHGADRDGSSVEAARPTTSCSSWPGLQSIPEVADRGRSHRRCAPLAPVLDHPVPAAVAHHLLPAGDQRGVRLLRHLRHRRCGHARAALARTRPSWSTRSTTTASRPWTWAARQRQSVVLMVIVVALTVVQFRFVEKKVELMTRRHAITRTRCQGRTPFGAALEPSHGRRRRLVACCIVGVLHRAPSRIYVTFVASDADGGRGGAGRPCRCCRAATSLDNYAAAAAGGACDGRVATRRWAA